VPGRLISSEKMSIITEHLGKLEGLVTLLRAVPYNASLRRVYLPQDIMMEQGVSTEQVVASLHASLRRVYLTTS